jgi:hypothetical protein
MATKKSVWVLLVIFVISAWILGPAIYVRAEEIKAVLLRPAGWKADFGHGQSEFIYEAREEKVMVKIKGLSRTDGKSLLNCERDVTITSNGIKHDGCRDVGITLLFDPKDQDYPFKGKSQLGHEYKLKAN